MSLENGFDPDPRITGATAGSPPDRSASPGTTPADLRGDVMSAGASSSAPYLTSSGLATAADDSPDQAASRRSRPDGQWRDEPRAGERGEGPMGDRPSASAPSARDLANTAKSQATGLFHYARDSAQSMLASQQHAAASSMQDLAGALRTAGRQLEQDQRQGGSRLAQHAADTLEQFSGALHGKDLGTLARDVEQFARRQPAAFIGATVAMGFLAMRFLKSSQADSTARGGLSSSQSSVAPASLQTGPASRNLH